MHFFHYKLQFFSPEKHNNISEHVGKPTVYLQCA